MHFRQIFQTQTLTKKRRSPHNRRSLRLETLESRQPLAGDVGVAPPADPGPGPVVDYDFGDFALADDATRICYLDDLSLDILASDSARVSRAATEIVDGGQDAARIGSMSTEVVDGGQDAARLAEANTEVVDGGQAARAADGATELVDGGQAARIADGATEIVNGGQDAVRAASSFDDIPIFVKTPEWNRMFSDHLDACFNNDLQRQLDTYNQLSSLEVVDHPQKGLIYVESGQPYVPTNQVDDVIETGLDGCSAGRKVVGQIVGAAATAADFVVDPVLGTIFYDENLKTGEKVFGENTYCSEVYANLQCVPALGGPIADVTACLVTAFTTDWGAYFFGADDGPTADEAQAAINRYRDLENRKDYDYNHGRKHQAYLWDKVQEAKADLRAMGIDPAQVR